MINVVSTVNLTEADIKNIIAQHLESLGYNVVGDIDFKMEYTTEKIGGGRFDLKHRKAVLGITPIIVKPASTNEAAAAAAPKVTAPTGGR